MKNVLCLLFLWLAATGFSLAQQQISVTLTPTTGSPCTFTATSVTTEIALGSPSGKAYFKPMTIVTDSDQCVNVLLTDIFASPLNNPLTVTITFNNYAIPPVKLMTYTLAGAQVTAVASNVQGPINSYQTEQSAVTLTYRVMTVDNLVLNTSYTCSPQLGTCS